MTSEIIGLAGSCLVRHTRQLSGSAIIRALVSIVLTSQCLLAAAQEPEADGRLTAFTPDQLRADLEYMYEGLQSANFDLYASTPRSEFDKHYQALKNKLVEPMTRFDAETTFQQFAALAYQAHTRVESDYSEFFAYLGKGGAAFPLGVMVEDGQLLVTGNSSGVIEILPGDSISAINRQKMKDLLPRLIAHISAESPEFAYVLLETYMPFVIWLELGRTEASSVSIDHADGTAGIYDLVVKPGENQDSGGIRKPFSLDGRDSRMLTDTVAYLRPGPFSNTDPDANSLDTTAFVEFINSAFEGFIENEAAHLIVDLRDNPGGDNSFSDPVIAWFASRPFRFSSDFRVRVSPQSTAANQARLDHQADPSSSVSYLYAEFYASVENGQTVSFPIPQVEPRPSPRFEGDVYVLVNRYSYSNAVSAAALIQDYGFGVIMGEQTVDMATTYGAMERFTLPNTGIVVAYPKALIVRPNGNESIHPITPDVRLPAPRIRGASDEMLEAAVRHVESESAR